MADERTYSISEVAALTGLHRNTVRLRVKTGALAATVREGKFGEEYRISHQSLIAAGLITAPEPDASVFDAVLEPEDGPLSDLEPEPLRDEPAVAPVAALTDLYQRHEQAMFRLGYLQGELERTRALAESAESLRAEREVQQQELENLRGTLAQQSAAAAEAERLRTELAEAQSQLRDLASLRSEIDQLKVIAQRPWWRFWG